MGISFSLAHTGRFGEVTERVCGIERVATTPRIRILPCSHGWLGDLGLINTFLQGPGGKGFSWERNFGIRESVLWVPPGMTPNFFRFFFYFIFFCRSYYPTLPSVPRVGKDVTLTRRGPTVRARIRFGSPGLRCVPCVLKKGGERRRPLSWISPPPRTPISGQL